MEKVLEQIVVFLCGILLLSGCGAEVEKKKSTTTDTAASVSVAEEQETDSSKIEVNSTSVTEVSNTEISEQQPETVEKNEEEIIESKEENVESPFESQKIKVDTKTVTPQPDSKLLSTESSALPEQVNTVCLDTALQYVGQEVENLYAAIGRPENAEYASSCMGEGEDGILYYNGFAVTTYRENGRETVQDAY